jgi:Ser/Thr protein kinase RdoA (MazF antagonist)
VIVAGPSETTVLDADKARQILAEALAEAGLAADGAELIRSGSNVVFRLSDRPVIARVARTRTADAEALVGREIRVARWLAERQVPAVRALPVDQPIVVDGWTVGLWESVNEREVFGTVSDLAELLRRLHALPSPPFELPTLDPVTRLLHRIDRESVLSQQDRELLRGRSEPLAAPYRALTFALPVGVIHGDANVGNVLCDRTGAAVLADLDGFCVGPREWDLVLTAMYYERYGWHTAEEYRAFAEGYGFDVLRWPGYGVLREIRELSMVVWLAGGRGDSTKRYEFDKRMDSLRSGTGFDQWLPF